MSILADLTDPLERMVLPPRRPDDAVTCPQCSGRGCYGTPGACCGFCGGRGWSELLTDWRRYKRQSANLHPESVT